MQPAYALRVGVGGNEKKKKDNMSKQILFL